MLGCLTAKWRWRVASVLVVLYGLCLATPTIAMAVQQGAIPVHCLSHDDHGVGVTHSHDHGSQPHHSDGDDHARPAKCCGLFSTSAIAPAIAVVDFQTAVLSPAPSLISAILIGRGPDRIDRPPRFLLSL
jgi:hypothetical protein